MLLIFKESNVLSQVVTKWVLNHMKTQREASLIVVRTYSQVAPNIFLNHMKTQREASLIWYIPGIYVRCKVQGKKMNWSPE